MNRIYVFICIVLFVSSFQNITFSGEKVPQKVVDLAESALVEYGRDPIIIAAVIAENKKNKTMDEIQEMDKKWTNTPGIADYMKAIMDSECGNYLKNIIKSTPYFAEIVVMDNQGATVAMTDKTSDYWQGDEAKFKRSYNNGKGNVFIDEVEFDESAQAYLVQVSVPVKDDDKVIGAITFGIDLDKTE